jgi:hypothetical protein
MRVLNKIYAFDRLRTILMVTTFFFITTNLKAGKEIGIRNDTYTITIPLDFNQESHIAISRADNPGVVKQLSAEFTVFYSDKDPEYVRGHIREGNSPVASWKTGGENTEIDMWKAGQWATVTANRIIDQSGMQVTLGFEEHTQFTASMTISLDNGTATPKLSWHFTAKNDGWYSVVFTGLEESRPEALDFLYQPLVWTWKRFPVTATLTPEAYATTAATFVNKDNVTEGIAVDPKEIPFRFATFDNSRFGVALRTNKGQAKPMIIAPIPGGANSFMRTGTTFGFSFRYFLQPGVWTEGIDHIYKEIIGFRTERQNATISLNQTMENMIAFAMDDVYSGWVAELKGSDYRFDVPGTVKNVSALHPLSVALTTGNLEIYRRRALPMIEYVMSREKYLYAVNDEITQQNPSHFLKGPCVEIGELAALHEMTHGINSVFSAETKRIFGKYRQLNLITETGGGSWQDHLAKYRISRQSTDLNKAVELANVYLDENNDEYPRDFTTSAGLKDLQATFVTDYTLAWYDLLELYEETEDDRFLDAAITGATQMLLWVRSNPMAPDSVIIANQGGRVPGVFPGRRFTSESYAWKEFDTSTKIQEQEVPAWRTSLVGLLPEVPYTYMYGPIMLAHHAAWMLRMSKLTGHSIFKDAAYNAVVGRYANFPGYYFTSMHTTVYQQPDYPLHPYLDIKYNAIFYNHIWPHIALIQDFLVSDAYLKSDGKVSFPSAYAPGYAFLSSKVYGHQPGEVFGNENVRLWLPGEAIKSSSISLNHLFGRTEEDTYLVLMNSTSEIVQADLYLNPDVIRWNTGQAYTTVTYQTNGQTKNGQFIDGDLSVEVPANGLIVVKFTGLSNEVPLHSKISYLEEQADGKDYFRYENKEVALGTITGMLINLVPDFTDAYIYTDATEKQARKVVLKYAIGEGPWEEMTDDSYPYEFSIHREKLKDPIRVQWFAEDLSGKMHQSEVLELSN